MRQLRHVGVGLAALLLSAVGAYAAEPMTIDLTYDSVMDMVRPVQMPNLTVHHNVHIGVAADGSVDERRNRNARRYSDRNESRQEEMNSAEDEADYVSWHTGPNGTLVRVENDPQSVRTMTVSFPAGGGCNLDVVDRLKPGFTEYEFLRISTRTMGFFSNYRVFATSCSMR
jgi:hypothetical protein